MGASITLLPEWGEDNAWNVSYIHVNNLAVSFTLKSGEASHHISIHYGLSFGDDEVKRRVDLFEILGEIRLALVNDERDLVRDAIQAELLERSQIEATTG